MARTLFRLAPRYTAGSPALVERRELAEQVSREEREFYAHARAGDWGADWQLRAEREGLRGVVEEHYVRAREIDVHDMLTGDRWTQRR